MKNIIFIAPPASGKGTQSEKLVNKYGYIHISTGDLLREEIKSGSSLGEEIDNSIKQGMLVSDEIVSNLLKKTLNAADKPFILDGYPRSLKQIDTLNSILNEINKQIDIVIYLDVPYDELLNRVVGRLYCPNCSKTYHKTFAKPSVDGLCDNCNTNLLSRSDDNEETFKKRYDTYMENTIPILNYYEKRGILKKIQNVSTIEEIFNEIEKVIK